MIYFTGDVHCPHDIHKLTTKAWPEQKELDRQDYLIICGDVGIVWDGSETDEYWQNWFNDKPFTTLFVGGNHENHDLLAQYEVTRWHGGNVHQIKDNVYHLMNGEIFDINGRTVFTLGGAHSQDKEFRTPGLNWWTNEVPSYSERENAIRNLEKENYIVDYIITHDIPTYIGKKLSPYFEPDDFTEFLDYEILRKTHFDHWYAGHYHVDWDFRLAKYCTDGRLNERDFIVLEEEPQYFPDFSILYETIRQLGD